MVDSKQRYKAYPEYKDSGVEWLGEIPPHWEISKLRYMFDFGSGLNITKANLKDTGIPCINYGEVHSKFGFEVNTKKHDLKCVDEKYLVSNPSALLYKGDLVFADTSEDIEGSGNFTQLVSDEPAFAGYHTVIARPKNDDCSRFYAYLMDSKEIRTQIRHIVKGVKVFTISQSILKGVNIWLPSLEERQAIADFLDYETAKIDTLIEKQQRLIELLTEKRQAVISHAVTKGLNPDVPMKDSGVEWLGEVPSSWRHTYLSIVADVIDPQPDHRAPAISKDGEGFPYIGIRDVKKDGTLSFETARPVNESAVLKQEKSFSIDAEDIIFCKVGTLGLPRKIRPHGRCALSATLVLIKPKLLVDSQFLLYVLDSDSVISQTNLLATGSTRAALGIQQIRRFKIPYPKLDEQKKIANFLDNEVAKIDSLIEMGDKQIQLMQERRTALISAAVTGKIDVRDWVKP